MVIEELTRREGMGIAGRRESAREAVKKGFSASGRETSNLDVLGPVGTKLKRARCFWMSLRLPLTRIRSETIEKGTQLTPILAAIPDTLWRADIYVGDAPSGALLVGIGKVVDDQDKLVVGANGRILVTDEDNDSISTFPLGGAIHESEC